MIRFLKVFNSVSKLALEGPQTRVDYSGMLTSGGGLDTPALLFDLKTPASSNERIFMSGEREIVKPSGRLAEWLLSTIMGSNVCSLDQLTAHEIMYANNSDNFVTGYREHGFTRAVKYGHGCDPDESVRALHWFSGDA